MSAPKTNYKAWLAKAENDLLKIAGEGSSGMD
jgi:hypothetical protein